MRWGNWNILPEMSVGQECAAEDVGAAEVVDAAGCWSANTGEAVAVAAAEEEGRPIAAQLNPPVLNVTL